MTKIKVGDLVCLVTWVRSIFRVRLQPGVVLRIKKESGLFNDSVELADVLIGGAIREYNLIDLEKIG